MNEAFEKIIEKLKEEKMSYFLTIANTGDKKLDCAYEHTGDALDKAIEIVIQEAEKYNNGWIPCSEQLPEEDEKVYISAKTERVYVGVYTKRYGFEKREGFICDDGFMWMNTASAWQPYVLPAPYQPKGE